MLHDGDRAGENDIGVDETAELHGVELSAELQPEALPADHARHAEQRQRQKVKTRVVMDVTLFTAKLACALAR